MADISLIDPYSAQQESIARQRRMAQALQQQAQAPIETPQMPGVLISPYAGLAKVLQGAYGGYQEAEADKEYRALAEEARKNQAEDLAKVFGAARAPARPEIAGQEAVMDMPERIIPGQTISQYGGTLNIPEQIIPKVAYQPAIAPQPARPAGYISPELIADIKDPTARNLALAQLIKQAEPETFIKGSPGDVFFDRSGNRKFSIPAAAGTTTLSSLGKLQAEREAIFAINPKDPRLAELNAAIARETKTEATALSNLGKLQAERAAIAKANPNDLRLTSYDSAIANEIRNVAAERLAWEQKNQGYKQVTVKNKDGSESLMKMDNEGRVTPLIDMAGEAVVSAAPSKKVRVEVTNADGSTKMVLMDESDPKFVEGFATKGPDYVSITEVNSQGQTVVRQVKKDDAILKTGYVKPLDGFLGQLQQAGVPMDRIQNDPKIRDLVDRYFVKTAGGVAPEEAAGFELRKAEVVARLGELGIAIPANIKGLSLSATPGVLGGSQSSSAAPSTPTAALPFSDRPAGSTVGKKVPGKGTEILVNGRVVGYAN